MNDEDLEVLVLMSTGVILAGFVVWWLTCTTLGNIILFIIKSYLR